MLLRLEFESRVPFTHCNKAFQGASVSTTPISEFQQNPPLVNLPYCSDTACKSCVALKEMHEGVRINNLKILEA